MEAKSPQREIESPTRWDALSERRLSPPYVRTHATCCWDEPSDGDWDTITLRWREEQFSDDFEIDGFLAEVADAEFLLACYGPTVMHESAQINYDMAALRATRVCDDWMEPTRLLGDKRFTPLTDEFQIWAVYFEITFPEGRQSCPDCP